MKNLMESIRNMYAPKTEATDLSHQAQTTMKHIPNASPALKKAAKDIKPGIAGYKDRVDMLKAGGVKEEAETVDEKFGGTQNMLNQTTHKNADPMRRLKVTTDHPRFKDKPLNATSQGILKNRLKSAQGTHSKPNLPEEIELEEDVSKMSTDKLKQHWDKHKDQSGASPVFAAQLKKVGKELAKRKALRNEEVATEEE